MSNQPPASTTVEVKKINGKLGHRFAPCNMCKWKNVRTNKILHGNNTHNAYIGWQIFNRNLRSGQGQPYTEYIGTCPNYIPLTGMQGASPLIPNLK